MTDLFSPPGANARPACASAADPAAGDRRTALHAGARPGRHVRSLRRAVHAAVLAAALGTFIPAHAADFTIGRVLSIAEQSSPLLAAARAESRAVRAGIITAQTLPNPVLQIGPSWYQARVPDARGGSGLAMGVSQRIDRSELRQARIQTAALATQSGDLNVLITENSLFAEIKTRFYNVLRRQESVQAAREDLALTEQIRERTAVRVRTGEGARFDLIRAETEAANAAKTLDRAKAKLEQARAQLREVVGEDLPADFVLSEDFYRSLPSADYGELLTSLAVENPVLQRAGAEVERARRQVDLEQRLVMPGVDLYVAYERDPEISSTRVGVALTIPLTDKRAGPIEEARRLVERNEALLEQQRFALRQQFEAVWREYDSARAAVFALEGGIIDKARSALTIAESAYRFGERGILDFLDAQRQFRQVRNELIEARFETYAAKAELERLSAREIRGE